MKSYRFAFVNLDIIRMTHKVVYLVKMIAYSAQVWMYVPNALNITQFFKVGVLQIVEMVILFLENKIVMMETSLLGMGVQTVK